MRLLRIVAQHFVAGIDGSRCAPIVKYMSTWSTERVIAYCRSKHWQCEVLE